MKKRLFAIALSLCMTLSLLPTAAFATGEGASTGTSSSAPVAGNLNEQLKTKTELNLTQNVYEDVVISGNKKVTLDLNNFTLTGKSGAAITVEKGSELTIVGNGTVRPYNNTWDVYSNIVNNGTVIIKGGTFAYEVQEEPQYKNWKFHGNIVNNDGAVMTIDGGDFSGKENTFKNNGNGYIKIGGGTFDMAPSFIADGYGCLDLKKDGKFEVLKKATATFKFEDGLNLSLEPNNNTWNVYVGATFEDAGHKEFPTLMDPDYVYGVTSVNKWCYQVNGVRDGSKIAEVTDPVKGDVIFVTAGDKMSYWFIDVDEETKAALKDPTKIVGTFAPHDKITFEVNAKEGYTAHAYYVDKETGKTTDIKLEQNVGTFEMPAAMIALKIEYIKDIANDKVEAQPSFSAGEAAVKTPATDGKTDEVAKAMTAIKTADAKVDNKTLEAAAKQIVANGTVDLNKVISTEENAQQIDKLLKENPTSTKATIVVVPFIEIQVKDAQVENGVVKSVTINVTPKVAVKATIDANNVTKDNSVTLYTQNMTVSTKIEMTLPVPANWTGNTAFVGHKGYVYTGSVDKKAITFQNPHGFSDFTVNSENPAVATNNNSNAQYTDLALAINEAKDKDIITLTDKANGANVTTDRDNKTVTLKKADGTGDVKVTINNTEYTVTTEGISLTTPRASSGGGGGSASTGYTVTANSSKNGSVSVTPKNASKGDTVTVTVKADKGYELSTLTVTDKDGKTVKLTDKGNGKYTFTMPGSKVEVKAEFVEMTTESANPFRDVSKNAYYYKQVLWAVEKGITSGVSANEFAPEAACTRGQMVTFLWKAAGSPEVSGTLAFNDVSSDAYYAKAVRWAAQQGITSGTSAGVFSPDAPCTRGQMAMFLYAYAKNPAVTGSVPFSDVASGDYFNTAVLWAVNNGITSGTSSTTYSPASVCTRGQMVVFLYQLLNK